jgi:hypothetical protein
MKKWRQKLNCAASFGNTEVKKSLPQIGHLCCRKLRCITIRKPSLGLAE